MAGSINKVILVGNLGNDPDVRLSQDNKKIVRLSIATSDSWKDRETGEKKEKTEWHRVVIFSNGLADIAEKYLKKGSKIYLEGQLQTRKYTDQAGIEKFTTEIALQNFNSSLVMLDGRNNDITSEKKMLNLENNPKTDNNLDSSIEIDDEIPF